MASGLITTSSFLGERYDHMLRSWVSMIFVLYYSLMLCPTVLYSGAIAIMTIFRWTPDQIPLYYVTTLIGIIGSIYAVSGGLKAVAVSDCFNGIGLLIVGLWVPLAAISMLPNGLSDLFDYPENLQVLTRECPVWDETTRVRANT